MSPNDPYATSDAVFPRPGYLDQNSINVSDYLSTKVWNIRDELIKQFGDGYKNVLTSLVCGTIMGGDQSVVFSCAKWEGYNLLPKEIFLINVDTGKISRLKKDSKPTKEETDPDYSWRFVGIVNSIKDPNLPPLTFVDISYKPVDPENPEGPSRSDLFGTYLVRLKDNIIEIVSPAKDIFSSSFLIRENQ